MINWLNLIKIPNKPKIKIKNFWEECLFWLVI